MALAQFCFDALVDSRTHIFRGYANRVLNSVRIGIAVTHNRASFDAQQRSPAELRVVETLLEIGESLARKHKANLRRKRRRESFLEHVLDRFDQSFGYLQRH